MEYLKLALSKHARYRRQNSSERENEDGTGKIFTHKNFVLITSCRDDEGTANWLYENVSFFKRNFKLVRNNKHIFH